MKKGLLLVISSNQYPLWAHTPLLLAFCPSIVKCDEIIVSVDTEVTMHTFPLFIRKFQCKIYFQEMKLLHKGKIDSFMSYPVVYGVSVPFVYCSMILLYIYIFFYVVQQIL